jgi:hypothetical protein
VAAGAFGFLIFNHTFDGPDLYGAASFFETMPSKPSLHMALKHFDAVAFGVFDVLNAATGAFQNFRFSRLPLVILTIDFGWSSRGVVTTKPVGQVVRARSSSTVVSETPVSEWALTFMSFGKPARAR